MWLLWPLFYRTFLSQHVNRRVSRIESNFTKNYTLRFLLIAQALLEKQKKKHEQVNMNTFCLISVHDRTFVIVVSTKSEEK